LISDRGSALREELIAQRLLKHSAALGRPRNPRRPTPFRDEHNEPMVISANLRKLMTAAQNELEALSTTPALETRTVLISFETEAHANLLRSSLEAGPLSVVVGELVLVTHIADSPDKRIAAVVRHLDQAYGWIPLGCITGDTDHFPPTDRMHFLTTPIAKKKHCASFERMECR